eukprot:Gregarina_sp_Poly_1__4159@NODE_2276_length_2369_cov_9_802780_g1456_i0_p1_GENE_NODE_2276_length_2369_cov_9_802780_g1456_i0NODE_2276_length_2369_cov_9_802780_g1456_i0_p1_ORF_typecomplete_len294_score44_49_NODE_2276_length_2369_cov_9_802780_g1456_i05531434
MQATRLKPKVRQWLIDINQKRVVSKLKPRIASISTQPSSLSSIVSVNANAIFNRVKLAMPVAKDAPSEQETFNKIYTASEGTSPNTFALEHLKSCPPLNHLSPSSPRENPKLFSSGDSPTLSSPIEPSKFLDHSTSSLMERLKLLSPAAQPKSLPCTTRSDAEFAAAELDSWPKISNAVVDLLAENSMGDEFEDHLLQILHRISCKNELGTNDEGSSREETPRPAATMDEADMEIEAQTEATNGLASFSVHEEEHKLANIKPRPKPESRRFKWQLRVVAKEEVKLIRRKIKAR